MQIFYPTIVKYRRSTQNWLIFVGIQLKIPLQVLIWTQKSLKDGLYFDKVWIPISIEILDWTWIRIKLMPIRNTVRPRRNILVSYFCLLLNFSPSERILTYQVKKTIGIFHKNQTTMKVAIRFVNSRLSSNAPSCYIFNI